MVCLRGNSLATAIVILAVLGSAWWLIPSPAKRGWGRPVDPSVASVCARLSNETNRYFFSQAGQDYMLWRLFFRDLGRPGFFVDVGANHWKILSNTLFFEQCLGWDGVCVEPNPRYHKDILQKRPHCALVPMCAWNVSATLRFADEGVLGRES